ncbi:MAG: RnfABCDGE type electron transport complex subunit D [Lachnospiraceae bacterium]|nr:RnfABCDGE type electron transport complex subunit D [Lachnospiraceae bacterium]
MEVVIVEDNKFRVSSNPHVRAGDTTARIMQYVLIALLPATIFGVFNFGLHALWLVAVTVASAVLSEYLFDRGMKRKNTVTDFSAAVTGLLLALNLPPAAPLWIGVIGGVFAIIVVKMLFGGLGQNFMNPALGARCFLLISFTSIMTSFDCDAYTGATPLAAIRAGEQVGLSDMVLGTMAGTIGETSVIAILIGAVFLLVMRVIDLRVPASYLISFALFILLFGGRGFDVQYIVSQLAGGGLMLGAFFMATDYVTRPITARGQYVYGVFLGIMTGIFRLFGASAEGVSYAIILGNLLVPLIEQFTRPAAFGKKGTRKGAAK